MDDDSTRRKAEIQQLYEWCMVVLENVSSGKGRPEPDLAMDAGRRGFADAYRRQDLRGMKEGRSVLLNAVVLGGPELRGTVDRALRAKFGEGLPAAYRMQSAEVKAILKRGHIRSDDEFRELEAWVEQISGTSKHVAQLRSIAQLLEHYAKERARKKGTD